MIASLEAAEATFSAQNATASLTALGAENVMPVATEPGDAGTLIARATDEPTDTLLAWLPNEALRFVAVLPWVVRLDIASGYPLGPLLSQEIANRLDSDRRTALGAVGKARPYSVFGLVEIEGCLDDGRRATFVALGAEVAMVIPHANCTRTIVPLHVPLSRLVELVSLPWVVRMESGRQIKDLLLNAKHG
jgi:hypothetical protein